MVQKRLDLHKYKSSGMLPTKQFYLGVDVSKPYFDVSLMVVVDHLKQPVACRHFDNTPLITTYFKKMVVPTGLWEIG